MGETALTSRVLVFNSNSLKLLHCTNALFRVNVAFGKGNDVNVGELGVK